MLNKVGKTRELQVKLKLTRLTKSIWHGKIKQPHYLSFAVSQLPLNSPLPLPLVISVTSTGLFYTRIYFHDLTNGLKLFSLYCLEYSPSQLDSAIECYVSYLRDQTTHVCNLLASDSDVSGLKMEPYFWPS